MAFKVTSQNKSESSDAPKIDYAALNQYVVDTCDLQDQTTLNGYVAMLVDLGEQEQEDAEVPFVGSAADEAAEIEKNPGTYFKDGINEQTKKSERLKCWPQKPKQAVAFGIDFPDIQLDKGQFFGDDSGDTKPLRLWLGGSFFMGKDIGMVVARPTFLKENTKMGKWGLDAKNVAYQMALSGKLIKPSEVFKAIDIDQLIGLTHQFSARVHMKESKGKSYYTEECKFIGALGRGQSQFEPETPLHLIQMDDDNSTEAVRYLPNHVVNTIKRANNFEGSKLQKQLEERYAQKEEAEEAPTAQKAPAAKVAKPAVKKPMVEDVMDDDLPF
jgi:hypothetical protein